jgi:hypothetical protein
MSDAVPPIGGSSAPDRGRTPILRLLQRTAPEPSAPAPLGATPPTSPTPSHPMNSPSAIGHRWQRAGNYPADRQSCAAPPTRENHEGPHCLGPTRTQHAHTYRAHPTPDRQAGGHQANATCSPQTQDPTNFARACPCFAREISERRQ